MYIEMSEINTKYGVYQLMAYFPVDNSYQISLNALLLEHKNISEKRTHHSQSLYNRDS